jgi:Pentapeptide repeats (8 copies)
LQGTDLQGANLVGADLNGAKITESDFVGANLAEIKRSQPWVAADKNRFQGDVRVSIDDKSTVVEKEVEPLAGSPPSAPTTAPGNTGVQTNNQTNTVTGSSNSNVIRGGRGSGDPQRNDRIDGVLGGAESNVIPDSSIRTRGSRDIRTGQPRRPQKIRRRFSIPAWVGFTQTSTTGGGRYHDPDHLDAILELW